MGHSRGKTGDADSLFLKHNTIALGWATIGDLATLPADREAFKKKVTEVFPDKKPGAIPLDAGQLFRFVHELADDDIVVYPSKRDKQIHLGKVTGAYRYDPKLEPGYPNLRPVKWLRSYPRTHFKQGALYEIGSAMSFFQVKTYADEFIAALEGKVESAEVEADETVALVAEDIEQTTRDFKLKRLAQELKGHPLPDFVAHLLGTMGTSRRRPSTSRATKAISV